MSILVLSMTEPSPNRKSKARLIFCNVIYTGRTLIHSEERLGNCGNEKLSLAETLSGARRIVDHLLGEREREREVQLAKDIKDKREKQK